MNWGILWVIAKTHLRNRQTRPIQSRELCEPVFFHRTSKPIISEDVQQSISGSKQLLSQSEQEPHKVQMRLFLLSFGTIALIATSLRGQSSVVYTNQQAWLDQVNQRLNQFNFLGLQDLDRTLLREFFLRYPTRSNRDRIYCKMWGLATTGTKADIPEIDRLVAELRDVDSDAAKQWAGPIRVARLVLEARGGERTAVERLGRYTGDEILGLDSARALALCGTQEAADTLFAIATDENNPLGQRNRTLKALGTIRDPRYLDLVVNTDFISKAKEAEPGVVLVWDYFKDVGLEVPRDASKSPPDTTIEDARRWLKKRNIQFQRKEPTISVRGGIDWEEVGWSESGRP